jgi:hypothetical protein
MLAKSCCKFVLLAVEDELLPVEDEVCDTAPARDGVPVEAPEAYVAGTPWW